MLRQALCHGRLAGLALSVLIAAAAGSTLAASPPAAQSLDHQKIAAIVQDLAPGTDLDALQAQIHAVVRDNAPAGSDPAALEMQVFQMFHEVMAQIDTDPAAKDHLKMMLGMITAAQTDPAAREHVKMMLSMHAGGH